MFGSEVIKPIKFRSRADAPECGNGPYFVAKKTPQTIFIDNQPKNLGWTSYWDGRTFYAVYTGIGIAYNMQGTSTSVWIQRLKFKRMNGNRAEYDHWIYPSISGSFPTTHAQWLEKAIGICEWVCETSQPSVRLDSWQPNRYVDAIAGGASLNYLFGEYPAFCTIAELGIYPAGYAGSFSAAYVAAVEAMNLAQVNTLENIISGVEAIVAAVRFLKAPVKSLEHYFENFLRTYEIRDFEKKAVPGNVKDLWLQYRYQYKTTQLDMKEYKTLISRLRGLKALLGTTISCTGSYKDESGSYQAMMKVRVDDIYPSDLSEWLDTIGVAPTASNVWDLIPYSFIADWFLHVNKIIDYFDQIGNAIDLPVSECWFTYMSEYGGQHVFFRVPGRRLEVLPKYITKQASTKTIKMRIADSISLLIGRY